MKAHIDREYAGGGTHRRRSDGHRAFDGASLGHKEFVSPALMEARPLRCRMCWQRWPCGGGANTDGIAAQVVTDVLPLLLGARLFLFEKIPSPMRRKE